MTKRYLWTIVGASLCLGANPTGAWAAKAPDDWVCMDRAHNTGECDDIVVRNPVPTPPPPDDGTQVRHLAKGAKFSIVPSGIKDKYLIEFKSSEWLAAFLDASPITWHVGDGTLLPDENYCKPATMKELQDKRLPAKSKAPAGLADYSYFESSTIQVHLIANGTKAEDHIWYIYPIVDKKGDGSHVYCLTFYRLDGESHDGAVHGDS